MKKTKNAKAEQNIAALKKAEEILNAQFEPSTSKDIFDSIVFMGMVTLENTEHDDDTHEMPVQQVGFVGGNGDGLARLFASIITEDPRIFSEMMRGYEIAVMNLRESDDELKIKQLEAVVDNLPDYSEK
jgi:predicted metalloprotease with PDZ domain